MLYFTNVNYVQMKTSIKNTIQKNKTSTKTLDSIWNYFLYKKKNNLIRIIQTTLKININHTLN